MTASLRRFLAPRQAPPVAPTVERCELCAGEVAPEHPHLVDVAGRVLKCACRPCALLFVDRTREMAGTAYRTVPDRYRYDAEFTLADAQWDALQIPVGMAFFLRNSVRADAVVACYPSPAGATESELDLSEFVDGVGAGRLGEMLEPDVEALLVRHDSGRSECLLVPVDACYRLVGLVRRHWRGFDGGAEAWTHIDRFFDDARARARDVGGSHRGGPSR
ncbi:DUF5947 family protein [Actinomycetospora chibensis]|uniref:DUF5947 family protein n=1 Tax=Actinomycetospora chibensis TaxID=663606 RepID=A0ABV9RCZ0_9PSEU|nr:DUF5947 family protein [Actinomycetospora chibensis]MDD7922018.1 DUF5947 family protein [Actinomycetospora chibensis]